MSPEGSLRNAQEYFTGVKGQPRAVEECFDAVSDPIKQRLYRVARGAREITNGIERAAHSADEPSRPIDQRPCHCSSGVNLRSKY